MDSCFLCLQPVHSIRNVIFLVVLAFLRKIGFVWPPYPLCFLSYLLLPCAYNEALPVLYWVTLCRVCFLHSLLLQYVLRDLGTLTILTGTLTGRLVHPTAPVLLTKSGPLGTCIRCPTPIKRVGLLTHLKATILPPEPKNFGFPGAACRVIEATPADC